MNLTENESMFYQTLAMTSLLVELSNNNFLNSDYYNKLIFQGNKVCFREILERSGLGNPATMQMFLYILLVMPGELLKETETDTLDTFKEKINTLFCSNIKNVTTTYRNEDQTDVTTIDFYNHTRNSVAHSKCKYETVGDKCYVKFCDVNMRDTTQHCEIVIETGSVDEIIEKLMGFLIDYLIDSGQVDRVPLQD